MNATPIPSPLEGEQVLATTPVLTPEVDAGWRRRLHFWTGRALTADALETEQSHRSGHLAAIGCLRTAGVVDGLGVALAAGPDPLEAPGLGGASVRIGPGLGVTAAGEQVVVPREVEVRLADIPWVFFRDAGTVLPFDPSHPRREFVLGADAIPGELEVSDPTNPADPLGKVPLLPWVAVLVVQPAETLVVSARLEDGFCAIDPQADAFADPRRVECSRFRLCVLPRAWLPALGTTGAANHNGTWRNRVAYALFAREAARRRQLIGGAAFAAAHRTEREEFADTPPPWERIGVPLGWLSFEPHRGDPTRFRLFLDRASVVRAGGWPFPRPRPRNSAEAGAPALWYARVRQFAEHLAELTVPGDRRDAAAIAASFRFLPPAGLLPREALALLGTSAARRYAHWTGAAVADRAGESDFFPPDWHGVDGSGIDAVPIPREELDSALAAAAPLAPYDLEGAEPDRVRILVPVPAPEFEPELLVVQEPDDRVRLEMLRLIETRQDWLGRRGKVRERHNRVLHLLTGRSVDYPSALTDPERTDADELRGPALGSALGPVYAAPAESRKITTLRIDLANGETKVPAIAHDSIPDLFFYPDRELVPQAIRVVFERIETVTEGDAEVRRVAATRAFVWSERDVLPPWPTPVDEVFYVGPVPAPNGWRAGNAGLADNGFTRMEFHRIRYEVWRGRLAVMVPTLRVLVPGPQGQVSLHEFEAQPEDWLTVGDGAVEAPLEAGFLPVFPDGSTLESRTGELEAAWPERLGLARSDVLDFPALARALKSPQSPVATAFRNRLREVAATHGNDTTQALASYSGTGPVPDPLQGLLLRDLNELIRGDVLHNEDDFVQVTLRPETRALLNLTPQGEARRRLNRMLIEDAFPKVFVFAASVTPPRPLVDTEGLDAVLQALEAEANQADDFVDLNFTRTQTNLYRVRKLVLGQSAAQKLLVNPAIATIAEQETATASADQLTAFVASAAKAAPVTKLAVQNVLRGLTAAGKPPALVPISGFAKTVGLAAGSATILNRAKGEIVEQLPDIGPALPPRGLTIGKRLAEPQSTLNLRHARAALAQLLEDLPKLRLRLVDAQVVSLGGELIELVRLQGFDPSGAPLAEPDRKAAIERMLKKDISADDEREPLDEATISWVALDLTESMTAILRAIEQVVRTRRALIARGVETRTVVAAAVDAAAARLAILESKVAEARHDVKVARALWQEELERADRINRRRDAVLGRVRFLAYVRPREVDPARRDTVGAPLDLAEALPPVPACLRRHDQPPEELSDFMRLFQHVPARWFVDLAPRLKELDTPDKCRRLLESAKGRALRYAEDSAPSGMMSRTHPSVALAYQGRSRALESRRQKTARLDFGGVDQLGWARHQELASEHATLGDLIEGRHGDAALARDAARQIELLRDVATCLHAEFALVTPALRLAWTERFSQFDPGARLDSLTNLPRWGELERPARRRFQEFVSFLFARIDRNDAEAFGLVNDLVRLTLLLASHAPVNQLIAGHVPQPAPAAIGSLVTVKPFDVGLVRAGMEVTVWGRKTVGTQTEPVVVARARVEDLRGGEAAIRLHQVGSSITQLTPDMRVQFVAATIKGLARK